MANQMDVVLAARLGDEEAFARLVHAEAPGAYRLALSIVRSPTEAEDAVQDAFLRAWRDIGSLRTPVLWPGWFRRLTVRAALDRARRARRVRETDLDQALEHAGSDEMAVAAERLEILRAFDRVGPDDRAILALRYLQDLEVPDVAAAMGVPLGTAKSRIHRALGRLRAEMRQET